MTVKHKRYKNYAAAESAAAGAERQVLHNHWALMDVLEGKVHWLERAHSRGRIRAGLCRPEGSCGGLVILVQEFPSNTCYDVIEADLFIEHWAQYRDPGPHEEVRAMRSLAQEVALLRSRLIAQMEGMG